MDDVLINKAAIIRRCLQRVREEYADDPRRLDDFTHQDALVLNLLRACEASIDLAMHLVAEGKLGVPQSSRDAFDLLLAAGKLRPETVAEMKRMVGFQNIAVHRYEGFRVPILQSIVTSHLGDFERSLSQSSQPAKSDAFTTAPRGPLTENLSHSRSDFSVLQWVRASVHRALLRRRRSRLSAH